MRENTPFQEMLLTVFYFLPSFVKKRHVLQYTMSTYIFLQYSMHHSHLRSKSFKGGKDPE